MKILIIFFSITFSFALNANAEIINCESKQFGVVDYNDVNNSEVNDFFYKIKIDKLKKKIFFEEVLRDGKISEESNLFKDQFWNITTTSDDDYVRAYGSQLGEFFYSLNSRVLSVSFPLGDGSVGVTVSDCY